MSIVPRCIIVPNFVKIGHSIAEILRFSNFQDGYQEILLADRVQSVETPSMLNLVKIGQSIRFLDFSQSRPSAILDSIEANLNHPWRVLRGLYHCAKFGNNRISNFENTEVSIFG